MNQNESLTHVKEEDVNLPNRQQNLDDKETTDAKPTAGQKEKTSKNENIDQDVTKQVNTDNVQAQKKNEKDDPATEKIAPAFEESDEESTETVELDEEEEDPFAEQKSQSHAMIKKIAQLVLKIEETVSRHKIKAECLKLGDDDHLIFDEQEYRAAKANRYDTGMSSEFLMKYLMQLDNCLSYGAASIKNTRKALVCRIKEVMAQADCLSQRWLKRVKLLENLKAENLKADVHNSPCSEKTETIHTAGETTKMDEGQIDENDCDGAYEDSAPEMDVEESSDDEVDDDGATTSNYQTTTPCSPERHSETKQTEYTRLPSWQPRTQIYQEHSHVVVAAFVPGMNMDKLNIMVDGTDLLVTGTKRPTMQDLVSYQHGRAQHFGHLNLKIALPTDVVHTEGATATYEDGVLRVKFIKKNIPQYHRPARTHAYRQPMHYRRPMHVQQPTRRRNFFNHPLGFW